MYENMTKKERCIEALKSLTLVIEGKNSEVINLRIRDIIDLLNDNSKCSYCSKDTQIGFISRNSQYLDIHRKTGLCYKCIERFIIPFNRLKELKRIFLEGEN